jgi:hypothetical protein
MNDGNNGTVLEDVRTKAIVDGLKAWTQGMLQKELAQHPGSQITNLGPTHRTEVVFPAEKLATIIADALTKSLGEIRWPQQLVEIKPAVADVHNGEVAKALVQIGKMIESTPLPVVEAINLDPLRELIQKVSDSNSHLVVAIEQQTKMMATLAKAIQGMGAGPSTITINHSDGTTSTIRKE